MARSAMAALVAAGAVALSACGSTSFNTTWVAPDAQPVKVQQGDKVLAILEGANHFSFCEPLDATTGRHFIDFPERELMKRIVAVHHPHLDTQLLDQVLIKFYWLREQDELRKKPSTSELIDWIAALLRSGISVDQIEGHIPFLGALLKNEQDTEALDQFQQKGGNFPSDWAELGPRYNN